MRTKTSIVFTNYSYFSINSFLDFEDIFQYFLKNAIFYKNSQKTSLKYDQPNKFLENYSADFLENYPGKQFFRKVEPKLPKNF